MYRFQRELADCRKYYDRAVASLSKDEAFQNVIIEMAFLKACLAWEDFLEQSFVYLMSPAKTKGKKPKVYVKAPSKDAAYKILGVQQGRRDYVEWGDPELIIERSKAFFSRGKPFVPVIQKYRQHLNDMRKVRNRIAHRSPLAVKKFEDTVRGRTGGVPDGIVPGRFLKDTAPQSMLGTPGGEARPSVFELWIKVLEDATNEILASAFQ
ncbi:MAG: hypothetical protein DRH43_09625 [Deltaproteobacteria bacterium]|nr:MAG: hypothetical protein DRH43_09625 [Deltaproteobacteria bacterium]